MKPVMYIIGAIISAFALVFITNCSSNAGEQPKSTEKTTNVVTTPGNTGTEATADVKVDKATELTDQDFHSSINKGVTLVDFWAAWCAPCRVQGPIVDDLAKEMGSKAKITKLNVDHYNAISLEYGVQNIPTIIIFKDGKPAKRYVGVQQKDFLKQQIEQLL